MSSRMLGCVVLGLCCSVLAAQEPKPDLSKKPQWQRLLTGEDANTAKKLEKRIAYCEETDDYKGAIESAKELLALRTRNQGDDHHEAISAKFLVSRLEKLATQTAGERRDWRTAVQKVREAQALQAKGEFAKAYPLFKLYADLCHEVLGEEYPDTSDSYTYVAGVMNGLGKFAEAVPLLQKAQEISRKTLGEEHPDTVSSYNNLAYTLGALGKYTEAVALFQKTLEIRLKVLGEEHAATASCYSNLAYILNKQGKYGEAVPLYQKALVIRLKVLGEEHAATADSHNHLAVNLNALGRQAEAGPHFQKALEMSRKVFGEDHPITATNCNNLAASMDSQGKHVEAGLLYQKALEINLRVYGENHLAVALNYNNLAEHMNSQGKYTDAGSLLQKALDIRRKTLGEEHPETIDSYIGVAINLQAQGKFTDAESLLQRALDIRRKTLGEEHPETATSYINFAYILNEHGKFAEAEPLYRKALEIRRKVLGEMHPVTADSYNSFAHNLQASGKYVEAEALFQKALDINRNVRGEDHSHTAKCYNNVAYILYKKEKFAEAEPLFQKALDITRRLLGEEHPDTASKYLNLACNLLAQGKSAEAEAILPQAVYSYEASRLSSSRGLDRASLKRSNPRLLIAALRQSREPLAAWVEVERSLARGLLDQQTSDERRRAPAEEIAWKRDRERVAAVQPEILALVTRTQRTEAENARLETLLTERRQAEARLAELAVAASTREVATPERIQAAISADAALLCWVDVLVGGGDVEEHWACVVRREGQHRWARLPGTGPAEKWSRADDLLGDQLRAALAGSTSAEEIESLARKLHAQRLAPVLPYLEGVKTLYVVPVDRMAGIPVEVITRDHTVHYVPSGTYLARLNKRPQQADQKILALGDPVFDIGEKKLTGATKPLPPGGVLITQVVPNGSAAKSNLRAGDVLLKYGDTELVDLDALRTAIASHANAKTIQVTVWRDSVTFTREIAPGRLGVLLERDPAPVALGNRRKTEAMLAQLRGGEWSDLPGTRIETNRLQQLFGPNARVLTDSEASEQTLERLRKSGELAKYRYLHFATHGEGNSVRAFESSLILSQDRLPKEMLPRPGEPFLNGQLSAREVLDFWKLNAELVTLSACETAIGKPGSGDGLLGFAQAFLTAGARSVCLSLWKVDDTATALLMSRFYENLLGQREGLTKPMGKAAALDEAKRWLRELSADEALTLSAKLSDGVARGSRGKGVILKPILSDDSKTPTTKSSKPFAHPKYWAAFILIGDPN